jgi:hypothetical protein
VFVVCRSEERAEYVSHLLLVAAPATAQRTTGEISGKVTDEPGAVLPGVIVTIRGAGVAGAPTVVTSETGAYRFPSYFDYINSAPGISQTPYRGTTTSATSLGSSTNE